MMNKKFHPNTKYVIIVDGYGSYEFRDLISANIKMYRFKEDNEYDATLYKIMNNDLIPFNDGVRHDV